MNITALAAWRKRAYGNVSLEPATLTLIERHTLWGRESARTWCFRDEKAPYLQNTAESQLSWEGLLPKAISFFQMKWKMAEGSHP